MLVQPAEDSFQRGIEALTHGQSRRALAYFNAAVEIERRHGAAPIQARYISYYGLCLGLERIRTHEAIEFCRQAAALEGYRPEVCLNLGRVLMVAGRRWEAVRAIQRGLKISPDDEELTRTMRRMGNRRRPALPFLGRQHPINVFLGRVQARSKRPT